MSDHPYLVALACVIGWLACSVGAYLLLRAAHRRQFTWTKGDRNVFGFLSLAWGPASLFMAALVWALDVNEDEPANW